MDRLGRFEDDDVRLGQAFVDVAAIGVLQQRKVADAERRAEQLQHALDGRSSCSRPRASAANVMASPSGSLQPVALAVGGDLHGAGRGLAGVCCDHGALVVDALSMVKL